MGSLHDIFATEIGGEIESRVNLTDDVHDDIGWLDIAVEMETRARKVADPPNDGLSRVSIRATNREKNKSDAFPPGQGEQILQRGGGGRS